MYFRVGNKNENLLETASVEIAVEAHGFEDAAELLETLGVDDPEDAETDSLFWDDEGHFGAGLYYTGVCCCDSLEALKSYFNTGTLGTDALKDACVFVFEGDWVDSCNDGEVVNPTEILEKLNINVLSFKTLRPRERPILHFLLFKES